MGSYKAVKRAIDFNFQRYTAINDEFNSQAERNKVFLEILKDTLDQIIKIDQIKGKLPKGDDFKFKVFMVSGSVLFECYDERLSKYIGDKNENTKSWQVGPRGKIRRKRRAVMTKQGWRMVDSKRSRYTRVPIYIKDKSGEMVWRMAPIKLGSGRSQRWVHPGINKNNFVDRAIDNAKKIFFTNPLARRRALGQIRGSVFSFS